MIKQKRQKKTSKQKMIDGTHPSFFKYTITMEKTPTVKQLNYIIRRLKLFREWINPDALFIRISEKSCMDEISDTWKKTKNKKESTL
jgi:hypothetical protein